MAGVEGGRESGLSPDPDGARLYKYASVCGRVPFVNFFPALEPHPLPCTHYLGPCLPLIPVCTLYSSHGVGGRVGVCECPRNLLGGEAPLARRQGCSGERSGF
ncbi:hypothetical protein VULLAG_LOCUS7218 [Vulpes lagopus]